MLKRLFLLIAALVGFGGPAFAEVEAPQQSCSDGVCRVRLTADQILQQADRLVSEHRFDEAAPLLAALDHAPQLAMERDFLKGYSAIETGDVDSAIRIFRSVLKNHPEQTRVRLELARALMMQGKAQSADHHFRLAQQDKTLSDDVAGMVRSTRGVLRQKKTTSFALDFGIAPDSNITNGTNAETVTVNLGPFEIPLTLDENARAKSGTGQFMTLSGSARTGFIGESSLLIEGSTQVTNYRGKSHDDLGTELAVGPELSIGKQTTLTAQAVGSQRWYGGKRAATAYGLRLGVQRDIGKSQRLGFTLDARRTDSGFSPVYNGWQLGGYATFEKVIARRFIGSASLFGRRDALASAGYSNKEVGVNLGMGGELPLGINASLSAGASKAWYDAPLGVFSSDPRKDTRLNGRAQIGLRSVRVLGFSPSVSYTYSKSLSNLTLYDNKRSRVRFALARYF